MEQFLAKWVKIGESEPFKVRFDKAPSKGKWVKPLENNETVIWEFETGDSTLSVENWATTILDTSDVKQDKKDVFYKLIIE